VCLKAKKTLIFEISAEQHTQRNCVENALIRPAGCPQGALGVFCLIFRGKKRGEHGPNDAPEKNKLAKPKKKVENLKKIGTATFWFIYFKWEKENRTRFYFFV